MGEGDCLDAWAVETAFLQSERLFGKALTREQIVDRYTGIVKKDGKYPSYLKCKLGTDRNAPVFWDGERQQRPAPEDFTSCSMLCRIRLVGFWFQNCSFGLMVQLSDAQVVEEQQKACPF